MRNRAAQERGMEQVGKFDIIDEKRPASQEPAVLVALDRGAKISRRHVSIEPLDSTGKKYGKESAAKSKSGTTSKSTIDCPISSRGDQTLGVASRWAADVLRPSSWHIVC
jgi:hypothetical protein